MLAKKYRLKSNSDISRVFRNGKTVKSSFLFLKFAPNDLETTRIAFSVGLNYSKKAPERNRMKRVLRVASYHYLNEIKPGFDLVFFLDKKFKETSPKVVNSENSDKLVLENLQKADLIKK
jgi:ribonuclease P protein component